MKQQPNLDIFRASKEAKFCQSCASTMLVECGYTYCLTCLINSGKYDIEVWVKERKVG